MLVRSPLEMGEARKLNPMDIHAAFAGVMSDGGFDVIIGNPPYVRPHNVPDIQKQYFWSKWTVYTAKADIYGIFIERATDLLKPDGMLGYIVSKGWMRLNSFEALRSHILDNYKVLEICELSHRVFEDASVETNILVLEPEQEARARSPGTPLQSFRCRMEGEEAGVF